MTIAVISAKGGVGKTTVTANVAASMVKDFGKKVLVIDGNITTPTLGIHLGILSQERTLDDVLHGKLKMQQAVYIHPCGLHIVPASLSPTTDYPDPEILKDRIREVKESYDVVMVDGAAGIGREVISAIRASDDILVVTNPDMASIVSAIKAIKIARSMNASIIGLVVNRMTKGRHEPRIQDIEELCETRVIATIPFDQSVLESVKTMTPVVLNKKPSRSSEALKSLAGYLVGEEYKPMSFTQRLIKNILGVG